MSPPHIALFPCSEIAHLVPFLRLAATFAARGCVVTLITHHPTVSDAESKEISTFFATHPHIRRVEFHPLPFKKSKFTNNDPFFMQVEAIRNSVHLLDPILSTLSSPLSALIADISVACEISSLSCSKSFDTYVLVITSARFFSLMAHLPKLASTVSHENDGKIGKNGYIEHPSLGLVSVSRIPPPMLDPNHFFASNLIENVPYLCNVKGILINTVTGFESESIEALESGKIVPRLAPVLAVGLFESYEVEKESNFPWLDEQEPESVLFVAFGSRTALSRDQILELRNGIEKSGCKFLWVLKGNKVDKDDKEEVEEILGESFLEKTKKRGIVIKEWVKQDHILAHRAIGGFMSHCGWNSITEAARLGVPILGWPQYGDQMLNAEVVEGAGLGLWVKEWGNYGAKLVAGDDIAEKINEVMMGKDLRARVKKAKTVARRAWETGGTSDESFRSLIEELKARSIGGSDPMC